MVKLENGGPPVRYR